MSLLRLALLPQQQQQLLLPAVVIAAMLCLQSCPLCRCVAVTPRVVLAQHVQALSVGICSVYHSLPEQLPTVL
jgi:hypothetical protein